MKKKKEKDLVGFTNRPTKFSSSQKVNWTQEEVSSDSIYLKQRQQKYQKGNCIKPFLCTCFSAFQLLHPWADLVSDPKPTCFLCYFQCLHQSQLQQPFQTQLKTIIQLPPNSFNSTLQINSNTKPQPCCFPNPKPKQGLIQIQHFESKLHLKSISNPTKNSNPSTKSCKEPKFNPMSKNRINPTQKERVKAYSLVELKSQNLTKAETLLLQSQFPASQ